MPGELRGWEALHKLYGKLPWHELFEPSIAIARLGFLVPTQVVEKLEFAREYVCANASEILAQVYCPGGKLLQLGQHLRRPEIADALECLAREGPNAFYQGPLAERLIDAVQSHGGVMTLEDLQRYDVVYRDAISIDYRGTYRIWSTSVPSSGAVVLSALKTMEHYPQTPYEDTDVLHTHRLIEAAKVCFFETI